MIERYVFGAFIENVFTPGVWPINLPKWSMLERKGLFSIIGFLILLYDVVRRVHFLVLHTSPKTLFVGPFFLMAIFSYLVEWVYLEIMDIGIQVRFEVPAPLLRTWAFKVYRGPHS